MAPVLWDLSVVISDTTSVADDVLRPVRNVCDQPNGEVARRSSSRARLL